MSVFVTFCNNEGDQEGEIEERLVWFAWTKQQEKKVLMLVISGFGGDGRAGLREMEKLLWMVETTDVIDGGHWPTLEALLVGNAGWIWSSFLMEGAGERECHWGGCCWVLTMMGGLHFCYCWRGYCYCDAWLLLLQPLRVLAVIDGHNSADGGRYGLWIWLSVVKKDKRFLKGEGYGLWERKANNWPVRGRVKINLLGFVCVVS